MASERKRSIDHHNQYQTFKNDVHWMFEWIKKNRSLLMEHHLQIGRSTSQVKALQEEHNHISVASMTVCVNVNRIEQNATILLESNHYSSDDINSLLQQLTRNWKEFQQSLEERTTLLSFALTFYTNNEHYMRNVDQWTKQCEYSASQTLPTDVNELQSLVQQYNQLFATIQSSY